MIRSHAANTELRAGQRRAVSHAAEVLGYSVKLVFVVFRYRQCR